MPGKALNSSLLAELMSTSLLLGVLLGVGDFVAVAWPELCANTVPVNSANTQSAASIRTIFRNIRSISFVADYATPYSWFRSRSLGTWKQIVKAQDAFGQLKRACGWRRS